MQTHGGHRIDIIPTAAVEHADLEGILRLCYRAFGEDLRTLFSVYSHPIHFVIRDSEQIISHACLTERWLEVNGSSPMRTAFVEAVATDPDHQGQGLGTAIMRRVMSEAEASQFEIGGLSTSSDLYYSRLGWQLWPGPLAYRKDGQIVPMPDERGAMVYRLSRTPKLDTNLPLSIEWRPGSEIW